MIAASKNPYFEALFRLYNRNYLLRRQFRSLHIKGKIDPDGKHPAVYVMNHCSWWDGLIAYEAFSRCSSRSHFMMMEERQLSRYPFFRRIGAFSIDKGNFNRIRESLQYAGELLRAGHSVWIFPQGEIAHLEQRPLGFAGGAGLLLRGCPGAVAVPVTLYLSFGLHQKPEASLVFGPPLERDWSSLDRSAIAAELEEAVTAQLNRHRREAIAGLSGLPAEYAPLLQAGRSVNETYDFWRTWTRRWRR